MFNLRSNCRYSLMCLTSMSVRITPMDRMNVTGAESKEMYWKTILNIL